MAQTRRMGMQNERCSYRMRRGRLRRLPPSLKLWRTGRRALVLRIWMTLACGRDEAFRVVGFSLYRSGGGHTASPNALLIPMVCRTSTGDKQTRPTPPIRSLITDYRLPITDYRSPITNHRPYTRIVSSRFCPTPTNKSFAPDNSQIFCR